MSQIHFGFMDPERPSEENEALFAELRSCAIRSFRGEGVCDLESFASDSIEESHDILAKDLGVTIGELRDSFYEFATQVTGRIRFPDLQSFFLFSFTRGVNSLAPALMDPDDVPEPRSLSVEEVVERRFPIYGPDWVCHAANREMPSLENVFCDFQDEFLGPNSRYGRSGNGRLNADIVAAIFLWGYFGGTYWIREAIQDIAEPLQLIPADGHPIVMCQVKRTMQPIGADDLQRVLALEPALAH